jgi:hypothetical protein
LVSWLEAEITISFVMHFSLDGVPEEDDARAGGKAGIDRQSSEAPDPLPGTFL